MAEDHPAQRAKQKTDAEGGKRGERAHRGADLRKKFAVKHQRGGNAVEQKIIPVDDGTREAAECGAAGTIERRCLLVGMCGGESGVHSCPVCTDF